MAGYVKATVLGNLGRDPEKRYTQDGRAVTRFSVAATDRVKGRDGEYEDQTTWVNVTVFGRQAESCGERLAKGSRVIVFGRLALREYETSGGKKGTSLDLRADDVTFLDKAERRPAADEVDAPAGDDLDDSLPF